MRVRTGEVCETEAHAVSHAWQVADSSFEQQALDRRIAATQDELLRVDWHQVDRDFLEEQITRRLLEGHPGVDVADPDLLQQDATILHRIYGRLMRYALATHPDGHVWLQSSDLTWRPVASGRLIPAPEGHQEAIEAAAQIRQELLRRLIEAHGSADLICDAPQPDTGRYIADAAFSAENPFTIYHDRGLELGPATLTELDRLTGEDSYRLHQSEAFRGESDLVLISVLDYTAVQPLAETPDLARWSVELLARQPGDPFHVVRDSCIRLLSDFGEHQAGSVSLERCGFPVISTGNILSARSPVRTMRFDRDGYQRLADRINERALADWRMLNGLHQPETWQASRPSSGVSVGALAAARSGQQDLALLYQRILANGSWPDFMIASSRSDISVRSAACSVSGHLTPRLRDERAAKCVRLALAPEEMPCAWLLAFLDW